MELVSQVVIPARLHSTRLPRKLLLAQTGKPVIQHTYEAACRARRPRGVCVAVDHPELLAAVQSFGGDARMTRADHPSGTDRVAEIARQMEDVDVFVNVQGDEPQLPGESIDQVVELLQRDPQAGMATLATPIRTREKLLDPACVKVVCDARGRALYFSRSPIPHAREWDDALLRAEPPVFMQHIGLYAYRRDFLLQMSGLPASRLEQVEKLEQLRVLEAGQPIVVGLTPCATLGIDTPHDYEAFVAAVRGR